MTEFKYIMSIYGSGIIAVGAMAVITYGGLFLGILIGRKKSREMMEGLERGDNTRFIILTPRQHVGVVFSGIITGISNTALIPVFMRSFVPDIDTSIIIGTCVVLGVATIFIALLYFELSRAKVEVEDDRFTISSFKKKDKVVHFSDISYAQIHDEANTDYKNVAVYSNSEVVYSLRNNHIG